MRTFFSYPILAFLALLLLEVSLPYKVWSQSEAKGSIDMQTFYDDLSPYGTWLQYPGYGQVWHPDMVGDFRPYLTNGHWDYTPEGWFWSSNYDWGWAPFHYGRWIYDNYYGWLWVPGFEWSPAWVTWGDYGDYYAWAPLMPGVNIGYPYDTYRPAALYWNVVGRNHIYDRDVHNFVESRPWEDNHYRQIHILGNYGRSSGQGHYYATGPDRKEVEQHAQKQVTPMAVHPVDRPNAVKQTKNTLHVYRPQVIRPQPKVYRVPENIAPVHDQTEHRPISGQEQRQNLDRLPQRKPMVIKDQGRTASGGRPVKKKN
ncbi:DUF6600 domain-containing protein [Flagellimonas beolgyonensis]|uniref:DUF6600 domain-containing protein n=1 Tax=Flagellimonas beolgyonensis TaxID=864064 RepID=UPI003D647D53